MRPSADVADGREDEWIFRVGAWAFRSSYDHRAPHDRGGVDGVSPGSEDPGTGRPAHTWLRRAIPTVIGRIGAVALILAALHGLEGVLWALAYWRLGAFDSFTDASIYSLSTMTTSEVPGVTVPSRFQMISALEAVNGVLLFGISTVFLFAVIQVHWQSIARRSHPSRE